MRFLEKTDKQFLLLKEGPQLGYKYNFCVEFLDGGKWNKHFPVLFSGNMAQLMNFMFAFIFPFK